MLWNGAFRWLFKTDCCSVLLLCHLNVCLFQLSRRGVDPVQAQVWEGSPGHYNVCMFQLSRRGVDPVQTQVWEGSPAHRRFPCRPQDGVLPSPAGRPSEHTLPGHYVSSWR